MAPGPEDDAADGAEEADRAVEVLLQLPFDEALRRSEPLRSYIDNHEDCQALREEFREHWDEGAPPALRQVLLELLEPAAAAVAAEEAQAVLRGPSTALGVQADWAESLASGGGGGGGSSIPAAAARGTGDDRPTEAAEGAAEEAEEAAAEEAYAAVQAAADRLLAMPLEQALRASAPLRRHVRERGDAADVEEEFAAHWGPDAPPELRQVLCELLDPSVAEDEVSAREAHDVAERTAAVVGAERAPQDRDGPHQGEPRARL